MTVSTKHPDYDGHTSRVKMTRAACEGKHSIDALGTEALPYPGIGSKVQNHERYKALKTRAIYINITGRTRQGLSGAVFRTPIETDLPTTMEPFVENVDGNDLSLEQQIKAVTGSLFCTGREILLVDFPSVSADRTAEDDRVMALKPRIVRYASESLINWGPNYLVLVEYIDKPDNDEFSHDKEKQYRVLRLDETGYSQQLYNVEEKPISERVYPTDSSGNHFSEIPAVVIGSRNNDYSVDPIPLYDIAQVNIGHYRNSADLEENCHIQGQLTLGVSTSLDGDQFKEMNPDGITIGALTAHFLGDNGSFTSVQAEANQLADVLMKRKEEQMIALGARIIEKRNPSETATGARIDATGENSVLGDLVDNVEDGYRQCIKWVSMFMGVPEVDDAVTIGRQFFPDTVDAANIAAAMQLYDRGLLGDVDVVTIARKAELIGEDRTDDEVLSQKDLTVPSVDGNL